MCARHQCITVVDARSNEGLDQCRDLRRADQQRTVSVVERPVDCVKEQDERSSVLVDFVLCLTVVLAYQRSFVLLNERHHLTRLCGGLHSQTRTMNDDATLMYPFDANCCQIGTATKHPVSDRVKQSFVVFDTQGRASECPDVKNYKWLLNPVWHKMLYSIAVTIWQQWASKGYRSPMLLFTSTCAKSARVNTYKYEITALVWNNQKKIYYMTDLTLRVPQSITVLLLHRIHYSAFYPLWDF